MGLFDFLKPKKKGIDKELFSTQQYQMEITALARVFYFENNHNYAVVKNKLGEEGLDEIQCDIVIDNLKRLNAKMVDDFQNELDSGRIKSIKITANPEHQKGKVNDDQVDRYIGYGAFQMERGDLENALELFDKALELDDKAVLAYANKGTLFAKQEDYGKAKYFYDKALELDPKNIKILENKMDLMYETIPETSESDFIDSVQACLEVDPMSPNALIYIIQFYLNNNDIDNALESVKRLFSEYHSESIVIHLLLDTFGKINDKEEVIKLFNEFEREFSEQAKYQLNYCRGLYLKDIGDYDEAISIFEKLNILHKFSWNYYQMGIMKNLQGRKEECLVYLQTAFNMEPALKQDAKQFPELENLRYDPQFLNIIK